MLFMWLTIACNTPETVEVLKLPAIGKQSQTSPLQVMLRHQQTMPKRL